MSRRLNEARYAAEEKGVKKQSKDVNVAEYRKGTCVTMLAQTANFGNYNLESRIDFLDRI